VGIILGIFEATKSAFAGPGESCRESWEEGRSIGETPRGGGKAHHPISLHAS